MSPIVFSRFQFEKRPNPRSNSISFSNATSVRLPVGEGPPFGPYNSVEVLGEGTYGAEFELALEDEPNRVGLVRDNH